MALKRQWKYPIESYILILFPACMLMWCSFTSILPTYWTVLWFHFLLLEFSLTAISMLINSFCTTLTIDLIVYFHSRDSDNLMSLSMWPHSIDWDISRFRFMQLQIRKERWSLISQIYVINQLLRRFQLPALSHLRFSFFLREHLMLYFAWPFSKTHAASSFNKRLSSVHVSLFVSNFLYIQYSIRLSCSSEIHQHRRLNV